MNEQSPSIALCPECQEPIAFGRTPVLNHLLLCPHCENILVVRSIRPLQLDWAFEEPIEPDDLPFSSPPQKPYWQYGADL